MADKSLIERGWSWDLLFIDLRDDCLLYITEQKNEWRKRRYSPHWSSRWLSIPPSEDGGRHSSVPWSSNDGKFKKKIWKNFENFWKFFEKILKNFWKILKNFWKFLKNFWKNFEKFLKIFEKFFENFLKIFQKLMPCEKVRKLQRRKFTKVSKVRKCWWKKKQKK